MPSMECTAETSILVIGACALDRLLHVPFYPKEDGKILCHNTFQCGGGNAANTASSLGRISNSTALKQRKVESKKKYNRKKKVSGYYFDYDGKERILYDDNQ